MHFVQVLVVIKDDSVGFLVDYFGASFLECEAKNQLGNG